MLLFMWGWHASFLATCYLINNLIHLITTIPASGVFQLKTTNQGCCCFFATVFHLTCCSRTRTEWASEFFLSLKWKKRRATTLSLTLTLNRVLAILQEDACNQSWAVKKNTWVEARGSRILIREQRDPSWRAGLHAVFILFCVLLFCGFAAMQLLSENVFALIRSYVWTAPRLICGCNKFRFIQIKFSLLQSCCFLSYLFFKTISCP